MRTIISKAATIASIALAMIFTFGCLDNYDDEIDSLQNTGISSSSEVPLSLSSSSQETALNWCNWERYNPETHFCDTTNSVCLPPLSCRDNTPDMACPTACSSVLEKCNGEEYNPETHYCENDMVLPYLNNP